MAKLVGNLLSGSLGPYLFRIVNRKQIVSYQTGADKVKQASGLMLATDLFTAAAKLGWARQTLITPSADLLGPVSGAITEELCKALTASQDNEPGEFFFGEDSFAVLKALEFNNQSKVSSFLQKLPVVSLSQKVLKISVPKMEIGTKFKFPPNSIKCEMIFALSLFRLNDGYMVESAETRSVVVFKNEEVLGPFQLRFVIPPGCLCLVSLFLHYYTADKSGWIRLRNEKFSPGCFIGSVVTPGKYRNSDHRTWRKWIKFK